MILRVVPFTFALPVHCGDDTAGPDLSPIPLVVGLLAIVAWPAIMHRRRARRGATRQGSPT